MLQGIKMKRLSIKKYTFFSVLILLGIGIDQLTKLLSVKFLQPVSTVPIIEDVIHLTYVENRGAAFGMLADSRWVFMLVSSIAIIGMLFYLYSGLTPGSLYEVSLSMIISGGIGNMIDRVALGYVVDMIDFRIINFAVFNAADSFVCVGAGLLVLALILDIVKDTKKKKEKTNDSDGN